MRKIFFTFFILSISGCAIPVVSVEKAYEKCTKMGYEENTLAHAQCTEKQTITLVPKGPGAPAPALPKTTICHSSGNYIYCS